MDHTPDRERFPGPGFEPRPAHLGWRLLGLLYDLMPVVAIWIAVNAVAYLLNGAQRIAPGSLAAWLTFGSVVAATGAYAVASWRVGGHTLGMRPWRLQVRDRDGARPSTGRLCLRFVVATLGLAAFGLGLLWTLVDRERRGWHDIAAGTLVLRRPRPARGKAAAPG
ncbi:MAG: RDD family protein [Lysobacteraceae bacterium]